MIFLYIEFAKSYHKFIEYFISTNFKRRQIFYSFIYFCIRINIVTALAKMSLWFWTVRYIWKEIFSIPQNDLMMKYVSYIHTAINIPCGVPARVDSDPVLARYGMYKMVFLWLKHIVIFRFRWHMNTSWHGSGSCISGPVLGKPQYRWFPITK